MSTIVSLHTLNNTRDLGGMVTADGRTIRKGKLFRSGQLYYADVPDRQKLEKLLSLVVDFRTERERNEKPDPAFEKVKNISMPVLDSLTPGITREEQSDNAVMRKFPGDPDNALKYMCGTYAGFVEKQTVAGLYGQFIRLLLKGQEKGILWHCTAGKDRAGFAAVIVEEILGVSRDVILAEHMATNMYLEEEVKELYAAVHQRMGVSDPAADAALEVLFTVREEYLAVAYARAEELYGSFDMYIEKGLGITREEQSRLKDMYLE